MNGKDGRKSLGYIIQKGKSGKQVLYNSHGPTFILLFQNFYFSFVFPYTIKKTNIHDIFQEEKTMYKGKREVIISFRQATNNVLVQRYKIKEQPSQIIKIQISQSGTEPAARVS